MAWIRKLVVRKVKPHQVVPGTDTGWVGGNCVYTRTVVPPDPIYTEACPDIPFDHPENTDGCCCYCVYVWRRTQESSNSSQSESESLSQSESQSESPSESISQSMSPSESISQSMSPSESMSLSQSESPNSPSSPSSSSSPNPSSPSSDGLVCWYFYTATYDCNSSVWTQGVPTKSCDLDNAHTIHGWQIDGSPCQATKVVKGSACLVDGDCTIPSEADPTISPGEGCCDYYRVACNAGVACSGSTVIWDVYQSAPLGPLLNKQPLKDWNNVETCADDKIYWLTRNSGSGPGATGSCGEPAVAPSQTCLTCSPTSTPPAVCPSMPPIGYVSVTINTAGSSEYDPRMNGTFGIEMNNNSGSYTVFENAPWENNYRGTISVSLYCNNTNLAPCPPVQTYGPNSNCVCFSGTLPAGWTYQITVFQIMKIGFTSSRVVTTYFSQPVAGGASLQHYRYDAGFEWYSYACDPTVSAFI
jgi:hypothetical protein